MNKIEKGEYVRTTDGEIFEFGSYCRIGIIDSMADENGILYGNQEKCCKIHSKNKIDIVEVGDYVNGILVKQLKVLTNEVVKERYLAINNKLAFYNFNIKDILTHEQFESVKYNFEEEEE